MLAGAVLAAALGTLAVSPRGAAATAHPLASQAAAEVLRGGGNAVDAAVAAAFALAVVEPQASGVGGGGFALVWTVREGRARVLDFREVAPAAATPDMFARAEAPAGGAGTAAPAGPSSRPSLDGGLAVAVPGAVKGYAELARRFGTRPLRQLVEPAARLAERGFRVGPAYVERARARLACLRQDRAAARELLRPAGAGPEVPPLGAVLARPDLARTLRLLGRDPDAFYRGPLARRIAAAVRARGGVLTEEDLARYRVREREPLEGRYRGHRVLTVPAPSAGGAIVLGLLGALEPEDPRAGGYRPDRWLHVMIEAEKRLYARRAALLGDPDQVPGAAAAAVEMTTAEFAARLRAGIGERATPAADLPADGEAGHTTHLSVVDGEGNAVSLTTTVNYYFGACVVVPGTGILLNDEMDDFDRAPGAANAWGLSGQGPNAIAPGKIPLSSMAPALVLDPGGRLVLAVGAAGGSLIPTSVAQAIVHVVDDGMPLDEALAAPRLHHQHRPDEVMVEPNGLEAATARRLAERGHRLVFRERRWCNAQAVGVTPGQLRVGASDPRFEGAAAVP